MWVLSQACPGLVDAVEAGELETEQTAILMEQYLSPMIEADVDQLVLGCTHYPFLRPMIERIMGPGTSVIDPAPSVARQVTSVLNGGVCSARTTIRSVEEHNRQTQHLFFTTGDVSRFSFMIDRLVSPPENGNRHVRAPSWQAHQLKSIR